MVANVSLRTIASLWAAVALGACGGTSDGDDPAAGGAGGTENTGGTGGVLGEPLPAGTEEVTFAAEGLTLAGTLHLPARREGERVPAVVFAHGSGPNSRDEALAGQLGMGFGFTIRVFEELAEALAEAGYAALRYDKRTCGPFNGCAENGYTVEAIRGVEVTTFLDDVEAAIDYLASREDIDPLRLYFVGHSQGGQFAPELLTRRRELRAAVMLAGPYRPIDQALAAQVAFSRELGRQVGMTEAQLDAQLADLDLQVEQLAALRAGTFTGTAIGGTEVAFWESWLRLGDEAPGLARALDRPLLALSGDYDWNVPPLETELWARLFAEREPPLSRTQVLRCVTHALNCISEPDWTKIGLGDIGRHVDSAVLEAMIQFLDAAP